MVSAEATAPGSRTRKDRGLRLIALFKFAKAVLLIGAGLGALQLLDPDIAGRAQRWATTLATSSDRRLVQHLLARAMGLPPGRLEVLALGAFLYAGLFITEGAGLWLELHWAEYLTVVATASFVPIEIFETLRRLDLVRVGALVMNLAVVAYLMFRLGRAHPKGPRVEGAGESRDAEATTSDLDHQHCVDGRGCGPHRTDVLNTTAEPRGCSL